MNAQINSVTNNTGPSTTTHSAQVTSTNSGTTNTESETETPTDGVASTNLNLQGLAEVVASNGSSANRGRTNSGNTNIESETETHTDGVASVNQVTQGLAEVDNNESLANRGENSIEVGGSLSLGSTGNDIIGQQQNIGMVTRGGAARSGNGEIGIGEIGS